jgi:drug/metabolite transporter (DMT)-like permease
MTRPIGTNSDTARTFWLVIFVTLIKPFSNLLLAWGMKHFPQVVSINPVFYINAMLDPLVTAGIVMQIIWLLARMSLLSVADLSFVLPVTAAGYGISTILGRFVLHEQVLASRWVGAIMISLGTGLAATSRRVPSRKAREPQVATE